MDCRGINIGANPDVYVPAIFNYKELIVDKVTIHSQDESKKKEKEIIFEDIGGLIEQIRKENPFHTKEIHFYCTYRNHAEVIIDIKSRTFCFLCCEYETYRARLVNDIEAVIRKDKRWRWW